MANKSWLEICEELGIKTDIFDPEKREAIMKEHTDCHGISFQKEIGGTIYEVSSCFNPNGRESLFQQFLKLILSQEIDEQRLTSNHDCVDDSNADDSARKP